MRSLLLLYNVPAGKLAKLRVLCMRLGVKIRQVEPAWYGLPIGVLTEETPPEVPADIAGEADDITGEMAVMCGFNGPMLDDFLRGFRQSRIPVIPLKAVLTEENSKWDSYTLQKELSAEHEALKQGMRAHGEGTGKGESQP